MHSTKPSSQDPAVDLSSTARIDRRNSVLAQIEAALLAGELGVANADQGGDPYNQGKARADAWGKGRLR